MQVLDNSDLPTLHEITTSDDRTTAIVATSYLESELTKLIKHRLTKDESTFEKLFKPAKPIGALATKIDLGLLLGPF